MVVRQVILLLELLLWVGSHVHLGANYFVEVLGRHEVLFLLFEESFDDRDSAS